MRSAVAPPGAFPLPPRQRRWTMVARGLIVLALLAVVASVLPIGGCGDNDNSGPPLPCCPVCGDGVCSGDEDTCNCHPDCPGGGTICLQIVPTCGDGMCNLNGNPGELHERCPQ